MTPKRINLDLQERSFARLQDLKVKTEAPSYTEVVKDALRLYEAVIKEAEAGSTFLVRNANGELKEYHVF